MNGTIPNHAKKHIKKAIEVIQKVRIGILFRFKRSSLVAFAELYVLITTRINGFLKNSNPAKIRITTYLYVDIIIIPPQSVDFYED